MFIQLQYPKYTSIGCLYIILIFIYLYGWSLFGLLNIYPFSWPAKHEMEAEQRKEILNLGRYKKSAPQT